MDLASAIFDVVTLGQGIAKDGLKIGIKNFIKSQIKPKELAKKIVETTAGKAVDWRKQESDKNAIKQAQILLNQKIIQHISKQSINKIHKILQKQNQQLLFAKPIPPSLYRYSFDSYKKDIRQKHFSPEIYYLTEYMLANYLKWLSYSK